MKKLVALMMVLAFSGVAGASLSLQVAGHPDMTVNTSDYVTIQVVSADELWNVSLFMIAVGPSTVDITDAVVIGNPKSEVTGALGVVDYTGAIENTDWILYADMYKPAVPSPAIADGVVVDGIIFHCEAPGDVVVQLIDLNTGIEYGTFTIHQVPEPMTIGLLGLGGLFLRRRLA